jgi:hypothetical protein
MVSGAVRVQVVQKRAPLGSLNPMSLFPKSIYLLLEL